jgi:hypothetical protein
MQRVVIPRATVTDADRILHETAADRVREEVAVS